MKQVCVNGAFRWGLHARRWVMPFVMAAGLALVAMAGALTTASAQATPPSHFSEPVNFSFQLGYYTDLCGFPVFQSLDGTLNTTLRYDRSGRSSARLTPSPERL